jgi:aminoglycoside/choline kinase family phosphotransferase
MGNNSIDNTFSIPYLKENLSKIWSESSNSLEVQPLAGDASTRRYYRVFEGDKSQKDRRLILMELESPQPNADIDFIILTKYFAALSLPVPELYHYDKERGFLFLEDFGDQLLQDVVGPHVERSEKLMWYRKAVDMLVQLQLHGSQDPDPSCPAFNRRFDFEKLMWEMNFMIEHFLGNLKKCNLIESEVEEIRSVLAPLCQTLADQELCLTHRDFHSRNIMIQNDELKMIDFQDARLGPRQYDLVSLLKDSYVELDDSFVEEMIGYFIDQSEEAGVEKINRIDFGETFDFMSVQRNLKAIGTFAFQETQKGTDRYSEDIPRTLNYVKKALARQPELFNIQTVLGKYIPEIAG